MQKKINWQLNGLNCVCLRFATQLWLLVTIFRHIFVVLLPISFCNSLLVGIHLKFFSESVNHLIFERLCFEESSAMSRWRLWNHIEKINLISQASRINCIWFIFDKITTKFSENILACLNHIYQNNRQTQPRSFP